MHILKQMKLKQGLWAVFHNIQSANESHLQLLDSQGALCDKSFVQNLHIV